MDIRVKEESNTVTIELSGKFDDQLTYQLETIFNEELKKGKNKLVFDLNDLEYLSNAGLRILLMGNKRFSNTIIKNVRPNIKEFFEITGFDTEFIFE